MNKNNIHQFLNFTQSINDKGEENYLNKLSSVEIVSQNSSEYLRLGKLPAGTYELKFLKIEKNVSIRIVSGKKWSNGSIFDERSGNVYKVNQSP